MADQDPKLTLIRPHVRYRNLPTNVEKTVIRNYNLTRTLIEALKSYCNYYKAKSYGEVEFACFYAFEHFLYIKEGKKEVPAQDSKLLMDRYLFFVDSVASELGIYPEIIRPHLLKQMESQRSPNPIEFIYYTYLLMPNLEPSKFSTNMNNIRTSVNTLWDRLSGTKHSSMQSMLFMYSTEGGVGKSLFQSIMYEWAKKKGIKAVYSRVPHNQFVGDEFNKNAICLFSDITKDECKDWNKINDLIDGNNYVVEQKGRDRYELKAQAFLIGSSNFQPKDENNRRVSHSFVEFSSTRLEPITKHTAFVLKGSSVDIDYYIPIVDKWMNSCPDNGFDYSDYPTSIVSSAGDWYKEIDDDHAWILRAIANFCIKTKEDLKKEKYIISIATLTNRLNQWVRNDQIDDVKRDYEFSRSQVNNVMIRLDKGGKIERAGGGKGPYEKKYLIEALVNNASIIAKEHTVNKYSKSFNDHPDYIQEKIIAIDTMQKILDDSPIGLSQECINFMTSKPVIKDTDVVQEELPLQEEEEEDDVPF